MGTTKYFHCPCLSARIPITWPRRKRGEIQTRNADCGGGNMMIRSKSRLAIHALVDLAANETERPVTLASIAARQSISQSYLEQLFGRLRVAGLVRSIAGPGGGFRTTRPLSEMTVADIVLAVDCESHDNSDHPEVRGHVDCMTQTLWRRVDQYMHDYLATVTLAAVANRNRTTSGGVRPPASLSSNL
jgi:Rrf2 family iron-sulfur cluster assembly transcriptional regulator